MRETAGQYLNKKVSAFQFISRFHANCLIHGHAAVTVSPPLRTSTMPSVKDTGQIVAALGGTTAGLVVSLSAGPYARERDRTSCPETAAVNQPQHCRHGRAGMSTQNLRDVARMLWCHTRHA